MTEAEILQKAIEKATKNGWVSGYTTFEITTGGTVDKPLTMIVGYYQSSHKPVIKNELIHESLILFSHPFAKAFFGEQDIENTFDNYKLVSTKVKNLGWQHHLQAMVLEENPIQYLEKYL